MTLKQAATYAQKAREARVDGGVKPLPIEDYSGLTPGTPEAVAFLNKWRPAFYGYTGVFAQEIVTAMRWNDAGTRGLLADATQLRAKFPRNDVWSAFSETASALHGIGAKAANEEFKPDAIARNGLQVPYSHGNQLLELFRTLDLRKEPDGKLIHRREYESLEKFTSGGIVTGVDTVIGTHFVGRQLAKPSLSQMEFRTLVLGSKFVKHLATSEMDELLGVISAVSMGLPRHQRMFHSPYDKDAFELAARGSSTTIEMRVPIEELVDARSCEYDAATQRFKWEAEETVKVKELASHPSHGAGRKRIGCLGLIKGPGGKTPIDELHSWVTDRIFASGADDLLVQAITRGVDPVGESVSGPRRSLAAQMAAEGVGTVHRRQLAGATLG